MNAFDSLRAPLTAAEPDRVFVDRLRTEVAAALSPTIPLADRVTTTPTPDTATSTATALVPYLSVRGAAEAIEWYTAVLGARETVRYTDDDGRIGHSELRIGEVTMYLSDEYPDYQAVSPATLGGTSVALGLTVPDVDAVFARAAAEGATVLREPADQPYGERSCTFVDPWGHRWMVQTTIARPPIDEIDATIEGFTVTERGDDR